MDLRSKDNYNCHGSVEKIRISLILISLVLVTGDLNLIFHKR